MRGITARSTSRTFSSINSLERKQGIRSSFFLNLNKPPTSLVRWKKIQQKSFPGQIRQYSSSSLFDSLDTFPRRHNSQEELNVYGHKKDVEQMLKKVGVNSIDELIQKTIPAAILKGDIIQSMDKEFKYKKNPNIVDGESAILQELYEEYASKNKVKKSLMGMGYYGTITPSVILRNVLESPAWYTPYTPYQAEISQGRLESLINYQTMVKDLTGLDISNASLLDEATAAAEAATMTLALYRNNNKKNSQNDNGAKKIAFLISSNVHPHTISVIKTRAEPLDMEIIVSDNILNADFSSISNPICGTLIQYPASDGTIVDYEQFVKRCHEANIHVVCASDLLALTVLKSPGEFGVDIAVGTNQRFGIPLGYGGPHAGFLATKIEHKRLMPGRIIGVSKDSSGKPAYRMSLQTREQHIRREKATSNICTAQALLSNISAFYAIYHGPEGLKNIAQNVHRKTVLLAEGLKQLGYEVFGNQENTIFFDTIRVDLQNSEQVDKILDIASKEGYNFRRFEKSIGISLDETINMDDLNRLLHLFQNASSSINGGGNKKVDVRDVESLAKNIIETSQFKRTSPYLTHPTFNSYHTEHELLRYIYRLQSRDISLAQSMIPLGSCTMKLNATSEMIPITWKEFSNIHPFAPVDQTEGYQRLNDDLQRWLCLITGFDAISLQPNSGAQGEYAGLMCIRKYFQDSGQAHRNVCLIPTSAHGTNPASAAMAAMKVVVVKCDKQGNIDIQDLREKAEKHKDKLAAIMVTYPSTHGVFEEQIKEICNIIHQNGGQVYMDGANMNAQVGLTSPGYIGADVCHLNLHKTFCIPHGGGGPGMGPIGVKKHLAPYLPNHPIIPSNPTKPGQKYDGTTVGPISAAPFGSASILPISWMYIRMMGAAGLKKATQIAILNANYMARRLENHYKIFYKGKNGYVGHELIIDLNPFKKTAGIEAEDVAKRLMDYGFHAPTMSFPITGTLMIEPTESESKEEIDRYCDSLISIREEIRQIEEGKADKENNILKHAPHTAEVLLSDKWDRPYTREQAAYPAPWLRNFKFWPSVGRVDSSYGDTNLFCECPPIESYEEKH